MKFILIWFTLECYKVIQLDDSESTLRVFVMNCICILLYHIHRCVQ